MTKQLELDFDPKSVDVKKIEKDVRDFKRNGCETREEFLKAKSWDRAFRHFEQSNRGQK